MSNCPKSSSERLSGKLFRVILVAFMDLTRRLNYYFYRIFPRIRPRIRIYLPYNGLKNAWINFQKILLKNGFYYYKSRIQYPRIWGPESMNFWTQSLGPKSTFIPNSPWPSPWPLPLILGPYWLWALIDFWRPKFGLYWVLILRIVEIFL